MMNRMRTTGSRRIFDAADRRVANASLQGADPLLMNRTSASIVGAGASSINQWPAWGTTTLCTLLATSRACVARNSPDAFSPPITSMGIGNGFFANTGNSLGVLLEGVEVLGKVAAKAPGFAYMRA